LPRETRLSEQQHFARVFERGKRSADHCFTLLGCANGLSIGRLGLAISKKAARRATSRNRLKRLAREAFRQHQHALVGIDVIVMARAGADKLDNRELRDSLDRHYRALPGRCEPSSKP
jgi:ribonuclease P protein component